MTDDQFTVLMMCLGFGFGTIFWSFLLFLIFGWGAKQ